MKHYEHFAADKLPLVRNAFRIIRLPNDKRFISFRVTFRDLRAYYYEYIYIYIELVPSTRFLFTIT